MTESFWLMATDPPLILTVTCLAYRRFGELQHTFWTFWIVSYLVEPRGKYFCTKRADGLGLPKEISDYKILPI